MAIQFSDTTNRNGLIQLIEDRTGAVSTSGSSYPLGAKTRDINSAFAYFMSLAVDSSGRWQVDDTNQTDYPIATSNLESGRQDYVFNNDGGTPVNQILDIHRVEIKDANGNWVLLKSIDESDLDIAIGSFELTNGTPEYYDKTSNALFLYPSPSYDSTAGLKIYYSRTPSYFTVADTNKVAGIPDMFHEYLALRPAYMYCLTKNLPQAKAIGEQMFAMEERIKRYYGSRQRDESSVMGVDNSRALDGSWSSRNNI